MVDDGSERRVRYVLLARLPREVEVRIEDAYLNPAGASRPLMGYHISLLGPFFLPDKTRALALNSIAEVCRSHSPLAVRVAGLDVFRAENDNVVFIKIVNPEPLIALHADLTRATEGRIILQRDRCEDDQEIEECYTPHVTLGLGLSDEQLEHFMHSAAATRTLDATFEVASLWLADEAPPRPWQYVEEYALGKTSE